MRKFLPLIISGLFVVIMSYIVSSCGAKAPLLQDAQRNAAKFYNHVEKGFSEGFFWTIHTMGKGMDWTGDRLTECFSGGCDLREAVRGPEGKKGSSGTNGSNGEDGAEGPEGLAGDDGINCTVTNLSNGVLITCGDQTAIVFHGEDGPQGPKGETGETGATGPQGEKGEQGSPGNNGSNGTNGSNGSNGENGDDGESCSVSTGNEECKGKNLHYEVYITCGDSTESLGKFISLKHEDCDD